MFIISNRIRNLLKTLVFCKFNITKLGNLARLKDKKQGGKIIGKITFINREPHGSIQEEIYEYKKAIGFLNYLKLTATKNKEKEYISKVVNYATELNLLTILKTNNLISEEDFFKIKNKIMLQYGIKSELMI